MYIGLANHHRQFINLYYRYTRKTTFSLKGIVSLYIQPITANESTHVHTLDDVWGMVMNQAGHGYGARVVLDRGVKEHDTISAFSNPNRMEPEDSKIYKVLHSL